MKIKHYKRYLDVPQKYRFNLEDILENKTIEQLIKEFFDLYKYEIKIKDDKYENKTVYLKYLKDHEKITILFNKISNYISNKISTNIVDPKFNKMNNEFHYQFSLLNKELGPESTRIFKNEKKLKEWLKLKKFQSFKKDIEYALKQKKYKFSNEVEQFILKISQADVSAYNIFSILTNSELDYGFAISKTNKKIKINPSNKNDLLLNKDESIRKSTHTNWIKAYLNHKNSLSSLLYQHIKNISVWALERKYTSSIESLIIDDQMTEDLLQKLYLNVKKHSHLFDKFSQYHKKFFEIKYKKKYQSWDYLLPLVKVKMSYTIEQMQKIVLSSLQPMGDEYISIIKKMFKENWIDYCIVDNKRSGAYSIGQTYGINKKYILMNFDGKISSVSTLAHEIGHSLHSYFSDKFQPYNLSQYPIFLAEIASIFNELMLNDYLLETSENEKFRFYILSEQINDFISTVKQQTMWSEYEFEIYHKIDKGESISTFDDLKKIYQSVISQYTNKKRKYKDHQLYGSIMVPHYYYDFYVYKYSIGYLVANFFFNQYKKYGPVAIKDYIDNFLSKGCSADPIDLLKKCGVNLDDQSFYEDAFKNFANKIDEYIKIGNKIFKIKI